MTEEERECAADLAQAERAFKTKRAFQGRPHRRLPSAQVSDEEVSPSDLR